MAVELLKLKFDSRKFRWTEIELGTNWQVLRSWWWNREWLLCCRRASCIHSWRNGGDKLRQPHSLPQALHFGSPPHMTSLPSPPRASPPPPNFRSKSANWYLLPRSWYGLRHGTEKLLLVVFHVLKVFQHTDKRFILIFQTQQTTYLVWVPSFIPAHDGVQWWAVVNTLMN